MDAKKSPVSKANASKQPDAPVKKDEAQAKKPEAPLKKEAPLKEAPPKPEAPLKTKTKAPLKKEAPPPKPVAPPPKPEAPLKKEAPPPKPVAPLKKEAPLKEAPPKPEAPLKKEAPLKEAPPKPEAPLKTKTKAPLKKEAPPPKPVAPPPKPEALLKKEAPPPKPVAPPPKPEAPLEKEAPPPKPVAPPPKPEAPLKKEAPPPKPVAPKPKQASTPQKTKTASVEKSEGTQQSEESTQSSSRQSSLSLSATQTDRADDENTQWIDSGGFYNYVVPRTYVKVNQNEAEKYKWRGPMDSSKWKPAAVIPGYGVPYEKMTAEQQVEWRKSQLKKKAAMAMAHCREETQDLSPTEARNVVHHLTECQAERFPPQHFRSLHAIVRGAGPPPDGYGSASVSMRQLDERSTAPDNDALSDIADHIRGRGFVQPFEYPRVVGYDFEEPKPYIAKDDPHPKWRMNTWLAKQYARNTMTMVALIFEMLCDFLLFTFETCCDLVWRYKRFYGPFFAACLAFSIVQFFMPTPTCNVQFVGEWGSWVSSCQRQPGFVGSRFRVRPLVAYGVGCPNDTEHLPCRFHPWYTASAELVPWEEANQTAAVHSLEDQQRLVKAIRGSLVEGIRTDNISLVWIGLRKADGALGGEWSDGTPLDFTYFDDTSLDQGFCAAINLSHPFGAWTLRDCDETLPFAQQHIDPTCVAGEWSAWSPKECVVDVCGNNTEWLSRYRLVGGCSTLPSLPSSEQHRCSGQWAGQPGLCYSLGQQTATAVITSDEEWKVVKDLLNEADNGEAWIALKCSKLHGCQWPDGEALNWTPSTSEKSRLREASKGECVFANHSGWFADKCIASQRQSIFEARPYCDKLSAMTLWSEWEGCDCGQTQQQRRRVYVRHDLLCNHVEKAQCRVSCTCVDQAETNKTCYELGNEMLSYNEWAAKNRSDELASIESVGEMMKAAEVANLTKESSVLIGLHCSAFSMHGPIVSCQWTDGTRFDWHANRHLLAAPPSPIVGERVCFALHLAEKKLIEVDCTLKMPYLTEQCAACDKLIDVENSSMSNFTGVEVEGCGTVEHPTKKTAGCGCYTLAPTHKPLSKCCVSNKTVSCFSVSMKRKQWGVESNLAGPIFRSDQVAAMHAASDGDADDWWVAANCTAGECRWLSGSLPPFKAGDAIGGGLVKHRGATVEDGQCVVVTVYGVDDGVWLAADCTGRKRKSWLFGPLQ